MEAKLAAVFVSDLPGVSVSALCAELGISRQTFYKYRRRWAAEGPVGLVERSRRPHRSPQLMSAELEDEVVRLRKTLPLDNGAQTIAYHLERAGWPPPSVSAVHRALKRRGLVTPQPHKRPRTAWKRFEWPRPNDAWQIDATRWALADGREVWIMDVLDDHSRTLVAARACPGPTGEAAWDAFSAGVAAYGLPARVMSDNGACFTARFRGWGSGDGRCAFEWNLAAAGIEHLLSSPAHPQTCGKLERSHQTTKAWLTRQRPARTLTQLQNRLDDWRAFYNDQRPHRALAGRTPHERWRATPPATPGDPVGGDARASLHTVSRDGAFGWGQWLIGVGTEHASTPVLTVARGLHLTVLGAHGVIRTLTVDPTRRYQPTGRPRGPRPRN